MFIVMNRFQINRGREADFESAWRTRERHLNEFDGFVNFALLKDQSSEGATVEYVSHTIWRARADFDVWRNSDAFRAAHADASTQGVIAGPPHATLYEAVIEERNEQLAAAN
ncbi:MAG TPA: antibiotic biosynthesis monooxygenase [Dehalococcoidia bacterium]|nr:antibiotic biosynthesis monooxygenase [Dehalococcoidia bacterium]